MVLEAYTFEELYKENDLEINETKLKIKQLETKLDRLERRSRIIARTIAGGEPSIRERFYGEDLSNEDDIEVGLSTKLEDKEGDIIRTGDRVKVLTPSKKNRLFKVGSIAVVEGVQQRRNERDFIKIRSLDDPRQRKTRNPENLVIKEPFKKFEKKDSKKE